MSKITPCLWYSAKADEAAAFYASIIPNSKVDRVSALPVDSPSGPSGSVKIVDFTLAGQSFLAFTGGPFEDFNHAISFSIVCEDQKEVDRLWDALSAGGKIEQCGWLRDRYGVCWQIVPRVFTEMMRDKDPAKVKRVAEAMMTMVKYDIATLQKAYDGR